MAPTFVLITGANRGLGLGLVKNFLTQPDTTVIAAVRTPSSASFDDLEKAQGSKVIVVKYDASVEQDAYSLVEELKAKNIDHLDIAVANAGIATGFPSVKAAKRKDIQEHIEINVYSVVSLYQATYDLLKKSPNKPIFAPMGSGAGALGRQPLIPNATYGASKSIVHWYGVRINAEDEWLNCFVLDPGWVQTDMGNHGAKAFGMEVAPTTTDESTRGMYKVLTTATKESVGGKVVLFTGEVQEW